MTTSLQDRVSGFSEASALRVPMIKVIDVIQTLPGEQQILSTALALHALTKGTGLNPHEMLDMIVRMERNISAPYANQMLAMMAYAKGELNE